MRPAPRLEREQQRMRQPLAVLRPPPDWLTVARSSRWVLDSPPPLVLDLSLVAGSKTLPGRPVGPVLPARQTPHSERAAAYPSTAFAAPTRPRLRPGRG